MCLHLFHALLFNNLYSVFLYHFILTIPTAKSVFGSEQAKPFLIFSLLTDSHEKKNILQEWLMRGDLWVRWILFPLWNLLSCTEHAFSSALSPVVSWVEKALPLQQEACDHPALPAGQIFLLQDSVFRNYCYCIPRPHSSTIYQKEADFLISIYPANESHLSQFTNFKSTSQGIDKEWDLARCCTYRRKQTAWLKKNFF